MHSNRAMGERVTVACVVILLNALSCSRCQPAPPPAERRATAPVSASAKASTSAAPVPAPSAEVAADPCREATLCVLFGRCSYRTVSPSDAPDWIPIEVGGSAGEPLAKVGQGEMRSCIALNDADCERADVSCREQGECSAQNGRCAALKDSQCEASRRCLENGMCVAAGGWCQLEPRQPCSQTAACRKYGACKAMTMEVYRIPDIYFISRLSLVAKYLPNDDDFDLWAPPVPVGVEPRSFWVAQEHASLRGCASATH